MRGTLYLVNRAHPLAGEPEAETGTVTLSGESTAVYVQGERRQLPVYGPGGCCWRTTAVSGRVCTV